MNVRAPTHASNNQLFQTVTSVEICRTNIHWYNESQTSYISFEACEIHSISKICMHFLEVATLISNCIVSTTVQLVLAGCELEHFWWEVTTGHSQTFF